MTTISQVGCLIVLNWLVSVCPSSGLLASTCGSICDYDEGTKKVDCSNRSLYLVPQQCFSAVSLNLQGNKIYELTSGMFSNFSSLKILDISRCQVRESQSGSFSGLNSLKKLNLNQNNLTEIETRMFEELPDLKILHLANNLITSFEEGSFRGLGTLTKLYMVDNSIRRLEADSFLGLKSLNTLSLSRNLISEIHEDSFVKTPNLENLYLGMNKITTLPNGIFHQLHSLKVLSLAANEISTVPPAILRLESLRRLDLQSNFLQDISPLAPILDQFTDLYLEGNPLLCSGCPEPLPEWVTMKYEDNSIECSMPDGKIRKVSSLVSSDPEVVFVPAVSTPSQLHTVITDKPSDDGDAEVQDSENDFIRSALFIIIPALFMVLIMSIIVLEFQTRQRIARKEDPGILSSNKVDKYHEHQYQDSDDDEDLQGYPNSGAVPSVSPRSVQKRTESSC